MNALLRRRRRRHGCRHRGAHGGHHAARAARPRHAAHDRVRPPRELVDFLEGGEADAELASALDDVHQLAVAELVRGPTVCDGDDPFLARWLHALAEVERRRFFGGQGSRNTQLDELLAGVGPGPPPPPHQPPSRLRVL